MRTAISWAIDKNTIVNNVLAGYGELGTTIVPPFSQTYHWEPTADQAIGFDIAKANQILDDAGYTDTDGDGIRNDPKTGDNLNFRFILRSESEIGSRLGDYITGWLKQIGIATTSEVVGDGKLVSAWYDNDYDMYIWGWGPDPDPDFILSTFTSSQCGGWSDTCYSNPQYDKLYKEQQTATTTAGPAGDHHPDAAEALYRHPRDRPVLRQGPGGPTTAPSGQGLEDNISPTPEGFLWGQYTPYSALTLAPRADTAATTSSSSSSGLLVGGILLAIVVVIAIVLIVRRRGRNEEDLA